jgi:hypothetical protein
MSQRACVLPTAPIPPGKEPDEVEYEFPTTEGPQQVIAKFMEAVELPDDLKLVRYRFRWHGVPGAWNDDAWGITWKRPKGA